jgi:phosphoenolpyruvate-protein phosphotransferase/dihydroxyacetone kinase phosphotransfer subunit
MVGLVLVSHSRPLAEAVVDLIRRAVTTEISICAAGGVGEDRNELGTDGFEILEAINSIYSGDGVLVLMDMGSAILSAETAREFLEPGQQERVRLDSAPLVEGGIAAAIQAQIGSSLEQVSQAAQNSLLPKREHLGDEPPDRLPASAEPPEIRSLGAGESLDVIVENEHGLHLRPAATLIKALSRFGAPVYLENLSEQSQRVAANSLVDIARLQIRKGHTVRFTVFGSDPSSVIGAIRTLFANQFGEAKSAPRQALTRSAQPFPVSAGLGIGEPRFMEAAALQVPGYTVNNDAEIQTEIQSLKDAVRATCADFDQKIKSLSSKVGTDELAMFEAQQLIAADPTIFEAVVSKIKNSRSNAAAAWREILTEQATRQGNVDDPYLRERAADFREVDRAVLTHLIPNSVPVDVQFPSATILICDELSPSIVEKCRRLGVVGVMELGGGTTSHGAILARALGLPVIGGVRSFAGALRNAKKLAMDGADGKFWIDPDPETLEKLLLRAEQEKAESLRHLERSSLPALSVEGIQIRVGGNAGSAEEISNCHESGADSIGLFRSEFLFQQFAAEPSEDQQLAAYQAALQRGKNPISVTIRLLDIGGDKPLKFLHPPVSDNPFLGIRGIRLLLAHPVFFRSHLRALLRLSNQHSIRIMVPMITDLSELLATRKKLEEAHLELSAENIEHSWPVPIGIMIETPAAAIQARQIAPHCDFFSLGTNDLAQYVLCAERGSAATAALTDAMHPAVLKLCRQVIQVADEHSIDVSICGELASDPKALPWLLGLGLRSLSVNSAAIPRTKNSIRLLTIEGLKAAVDKILETAVTADEVRRSEVD